MCFHHILNWFTSDISCPYIVIKVLHNLLDFQTSYTPSYTSDAIVIENNEDEASDTNESEDGSIDNTITDSSFDESSELNNNSTLSSFGETISELTANSTFLDKVLIYNGYRFTDCSGFRDCLLQSYNNLLRPSLF